jgi:hypothetical protein
VALNKPLIFIVIVAFFLRILLATQAPGLEYQAYSTVNQVEHIKDTGLPLLTNELSGDTENGVAYPLYAYIIALSTLFLPDNLAYIITPNLIAITLHIAIFYLILELTNNKQLSLLGSAASIFIPSYITATLLTLSSLSLAVPLLLVFVTLFLKLRKTKENRNVLLFVFVVLAFTHPISLLCIPFLIISVILSTIRRSRDEVIQQEFALFAILFLTWLYILLYRKSLATIGVKTIFGNLPAAAMQTVYMHVSLTALATAVGIVPFGLALYAAYREGVAHHIGIQATIALALSTVLVIIAKLVPLETGLAVFSVVCVVLAAVGLQHLHQYSKALRRTTLPLITGVILLVMFLFTSVLATVTAGVEQALQAAPNEVLEAAYWLKENSPPGSLVLTRPEQGHLIEAVANRPVYIHTDYLSLPDAAQRYSIAQGIYAGSRPGYAARQEHIEYILSDEQLTDKCLNTVYTKGVYVAKVLCR